MSKAAKPRMPKGKNLKKASKKIQEAQAHLDQNNQDEAIKALIEAEKVAPGHTEIHLTLGKLLLQKKQESEAAKQFKKTLKADPDNLAAIIELSQLYHKWLKLDEAKALIKHGLELAPKHPSVYAIYAIILQKGYEMERAELFYRKALKLRLDQPKKYPTVAQKKPPKPEHDFDKPETEALLWDTLHALAQAGVHAFASYGTLLGLIREGSLLPFDKDFDLGLPLNELQKAKKCLERHGWVLDPNQFVDSPLVFIHLASKITLDLTGHFIDKKTNTTYEGILTRKIPYKDCRLSKLPSLDLVRSQDPKGRFIWALKHPESFLEALYGDWKIPDPYFDTILCAKNLDGFPIMTRCYAYMRLYDYWTQGNIPKALAVTRAALNHMPEDTLLKRAEENFAAVNHCPAITKI